MTSAAPLPPWRLLGVERGEPAALLARGLELLDGLEADPAPALRWYVATQPAIVLGRGQRVPARATAMPMLTRHSGGGAVLMDEALLTLDVLLPASHPWLGGDLGEVFLRVGQVWAGALGDLGLSGLTVHPDAPAARRLGDARERLLADVCYALPGKGEVLHDGRKLVGLAQRRRRHGALVQCGLLRRWRPAPLLTALGAAPDDPQILGAAVGLDELLPGPPDDSAVIAAVEARMSGAASG